MSVGLTVEGLNIRFSSGFHPVRDVSFSVRHGETLGIVGESGSGKSLTALALMGLLPATAKTEAAAMNFGDIDLMRLSEKEFRDIRGKRISMIFQDPMTSLNPSLTIGEQLSEGYLRHTKASRREALEHAADMLVHVGIPDARRRLAAYPHQLSGGLRQRVMIASALMCKPDLLIADEPTTALDVTIQAEILDLLSALQEQYRMGIVLITHDMGVVARMAHQSAVMYAGQIVETAPTATLLSDPVHPYTRALIDCIPVRTRTIPGTRLNTIDGTVPALKQHFGGCHFFNRCTLAHGECQAAPVSMQTHLDHSYRCILDSREIVARLDRSRSSLSGEPIGGAIETGAPLLRMKNVSKSYVISGGLMQKGRTIDAVAGVELQLNKGDILGLVGESGSGKTTITQMLIGLLNPTGGDVFFDGENIAGVPRSVLARRIQPVFQDPYSSLNPRKTIASIVGLPLKIHNIGDPAGRRPVIVNMLKSVGLAERHADVYPAELSGGQRQRVAIARALISRPEIIICDEPTSALDVSVQAQILNLLLELRHSFNLTFLIVSHNLDVIRHMANRVAVIYQGRVVESGPTEEVFLRPQQAYTQRLLNSATNLDPKANKEMA